MADHDLIIRNATIITDGDTLEGDIAVDAETIAAVGNVSGSGAREVDAAGKWVLPGGIDSHCHIEQMASTGIWTA